MWSIGKNDALVSASESRSPVPSEAVCHGESPSFVPLEIAGIDEYGTRSDGDILATIPDPQKRAIVRKWTLGDVDRLCRQSKDFKFEFCQSSAAVWSSFLERDFGLSPFADKCIDPSPWIREIIAKDFNLHCIVPSSKQTSSALQEALYRFLYGRQEWYTAIVNEKNTLMTIIAKFHKGKPFLTTADLVEKLPDVDPAEHSFYWAYTQAHETAASIVLKSHPLDPSVRRIEARFSIKENGISIGFSPDYLWFGDRFLSTKERKKLKMRALKFLMDKKIADGDIDISDIEGAEDDIENTMYRIYENRIRVVGGQHPLILFSNLPRRIVGLDIKENGEFRMWTHTFEKTTPSHFQGRPDQMYNMQIKFGWCHVQLDTDTGSALLIDLRSDAKTIVRLHVSIPKTRLIGPGVYFFEQRIGNILSRKTIMQAKKVTPHHSHIEVPIPKPLSSFKYAPYTLIDEEQAAFMHRRKFPEKEEQVIVVHQSEGYTEQ